MKDFDESEHETYSEEQPNALLPEEVPRFLGAMRELFPQHLRWHVGTQLATALLNKPIEEVGRAIGLSKRFTQRGRGRSTTWRGRRRWRAWSRASPGT